MILVMNKKHGVGCSVLAYNLGRLFDLPIYVNKDSFMLDEEYSANFEHVSMRTGAIKHGIYDIGANFEKYNKKFIHNAKLIIIPFEYGFESMIETIKTLKYIEFASSRKIPTMLVLNRLDKEDKERDFNYTQSMKELFDENGIRFSNIFNKNDTGNLYLTYLRNSYGLQSNLESGEYFMDKMYDKKYISDALNNLDGFRKEKNMFDYRFFLHIASQIIEQVDYRNEEIYIPDKDMVMFRNSFVGRYVNKFYPNLERGLESDLDSYFEKNRGVAKSSSLNSLINKTYAHSKEKKLIKDMAYIGFLVDVLYENKKVV